MRLFRYLPALFAILWLAGCTTHRPYMPGPFEIKDSAPDGVRDWAKIPDAVPKPEPRSRYGNKSPYTVLGKTYYVMPSAMGYRQYGIASWYGKKFSGRTTSSQEPYDPFAMTAAHKTLPIPCYVRVTNLENGRSVIVRVNDRGPFHDNRILDLSYAAAHKLGYADKGTARVLVEAIDPNVPQPAPTATTAPPATPPSNASSNAAATAPQHIYLQVGAFSDITTASRLQKQLSNLVPVPVGIFSQDDNGHSDNVHRVRVGPFASEETARLTADRIRAAGLGVPLLIRR